MKARHLCVVAALCAWPALAHADFNLTFGVRWEPMRYVLPQIPTSVQPASTASDPAAPGNTGTSTLPSTSSLNAFQRQDFNGFIGVGFTDKLTLQLGIDFARASLGATAGDQSPVSRGFTTFGIDVGVKYNFTTPRKDKISPYVYADFFKYFTALNDDRSNNLQQNEVEFSAGLAAPMGFRVAFGIEYYFSESFALGAEILGLQGAFASGSMTRTEDGQRVAHDQSLNTIAFYTALTLTFRFPNLVRYSGGGRRYRDRDDRD